MKVLIIYYSRGGTVKKMAEYICQELKNLGCEAQLRFVLDANPDELLDYQGIIIGSPTYYGTMASEIKKLLDDSVKHHGKLDGKLGAAFTSSANIGGGNETTLLSILQAMLIHGMIVQGDYQGDHYGPVAIGDFDQRCQDICKRFSQRFFSLLKKINS